MIAATVAKVHGLFKLSIFCHRHREAESSYSKVPPLKYVLLKLSFKSLQKANRKYLLCEQMTLSKHFLSLVQTIKLLYETQCCRHKFHGVYIRETCFKRFLEFRETVSSNRTLLHFLKLVDDKSITAQHFLKVSLPAINNLTQLRKGSFS